MTEEEWLAGTGPALMLASLPDAVVTPSRLRRAAART
jgi:hypothetical protein